MLRRSTVRRHLSSAGLFHKRRAAVSVMRAPTSTIVVGGVAAPSPLQQGVAPSAQMRTVLSRSMQGMNKGLLSDDIIDAVTFKRFDESDFNQIDRIYNAYMGYFDHIKFRKEWDKPKYVKSEAEPMFREAAEYVYRVRCHLDSGRVEGETTLRLLDGEAQKFLHSDTGPRLVKTDQSQFVSHLVHATLSDARGYVEGLSEAPINRIVARLQRHRFCPAEHLRHVLLEGLDIIDNADIEALDAKEPLHFVDDGSDEDKSWRASIGSAYDAVEAAMKALELRSKGPGAQASMPPASAKVAELAEEKVAGSAAPAADEASADASAAPSDAQATPAETAPK